MDPYGSHMDPFLHPASWEILVADFAEHAAIDRLGAECVDHRGIQLQRLQEVANLAVEAQWWCRYPLVMSK